MMRKVVLSAIAVVASALTISNGHAGGIALTVDAAMPGKPISPDLIGIFFEDLSYAGDGGLYAELIQNRSFEYNATEQPHWNNLSFWTLGKHADVKGELVVEKACPPQKFDLGLGSGQLP